MMKRTMIHLPEELHDGLRRLAFERRASIASLIRKAVERVYGEDIVDLREGEAEMARYRADPGTAATVEEVRARGRASVRG